MRSRYAWSAGLALLVSVSLAGADALLVDRPGECATEPHPGPFARDTTTELRLALNVPAYRVDVFERGALTRSYSVAVGQPRYRTPIGRFRIDYVVWNPWWRPPSSEWARNERPQPPGWANPTGRVKLHVTGLVFMHGTPSENSLGSAASHACVRMANADAIALARLVHAYAGPPLAPASLDSLIADTARTRTVALARTVPIEMGYTLAEVRERALLLHRDVYRRLESSAGAGETRAMMALLRAGIDTTGIRADRLRQLVRDSRRASVRLAVDSLFAPPPAPRAHGFRVVTREKDDQPGRRAGESSPTPRSRSANAARPPASTPATRAAEGRS